MRKEFLLLFLFLAIGLVMAADFTPQGDINLRDVYAIKNATNINGTGNFTTSGYFVGNGQYITGVPGANTSFNESYTDTLYAGIEWDYNQTIPANTYTDEVNTSQSSWIVNTFATIANLALKVSWTDLWSQVYNETEIDLFSLSHWTDDLGDRGYTSVSNFTNDLGYYNSTNPQAELDPYWTGNQSSYSTTADIVAFGYYNATDFVITDYFTKSEIEGFNYWNDTYATFNKTYADTLYSGIEWDYNQTTPAVNEILAFNYYNSTDFSISDYFTKLEVLGFGYYNSTDFVISDYATNVKVDSLGNFSAYVQPTHLTNFTNDLNIGNWTADKGDYYTSAQTDTAIENANTSVVNWVDALFPRISELVDLLGNWSADKDDYSTTAEADLLYAGIEWDYNQTEPAVNEILGYGYYNATGFDITDYATLAVLNNGTYSFQWNYDYGDLINAPTALTDFDNDLNIGNWTLDKPDYASLAVLNNGTYANVAETDPVWTSEKGDYVLHSYLTSAHYNKTEINAINTSMKNYVDSNPWSFITSSALAPYVPWTTLWTQVYNETEVNAINTSMKNYIDGTFFNDIANFTGTLTDTKLCIYTEGVGIVCNSEPGAETDPYWTGNQSSYSTTAEILGWSYYNSTDFDIADYALLTTLNNGSYFNVAETDPVFKSYKGYYFLHSYLTSAHFNKTEILGFGYYNATDFDISDYATLAVLNNGTYSFQWDYDYGDLINTPTIPTAVSDLTNDLGYYNITDFDIADYPTLAEVLAFGYYNSTDFDIADYATLAILNNGTYETTDAEIWAIAGNGTLATAASLASYRTLTNFSFLGGNVGIGTDSPDGKLHIMQSDASATPHSFSQLILEENDNVAFQFLTANDKTAYIMFGDPDDDNSGQIRYSHSDNEMAFKTGGVDDRLVIDSTGQIGIGTATPQNTLNIVGDLNVSIGDVYLDSTKKVCFNQACNKYIFDNGTNLIISG